MNTDFRTSLIKSKPTVFLLLVIGLTIFLGFFVWQFYSQIPGDTTVLPERTLTPHDELYAIHFAREGRGWAVGKFGLILYTPDGGKSWSQQNSGTTRSLTSVSFADDRHGFAVGSGGRILTTTDAGYSWQPRDSGIKDHLLEVHALSARSAFVVGAFGTVLSTNDGGANWRMHKLPWQKLIPDIIRETGAVEPNLNTVHFADTKHGWLGGEFGLILRTHDGGETWVRQRSGSTFPQIVAIRCRDKLYALGAGQKGTLLETTDGGKTWQRLSAGAEQDLYGISLAETGAIVVGRSVILKTGNGLDWARVDSPAQNIWLSGVAISGKNALAVGQSGTIHTLTLDASGRVAQGMEIKAP